MPTKKRPQAGSAEAAIQAAKNAAAGIPKIPAHITLRPKDLPFWEGIMLARARDEWTDPDLVVAAQLARCQSDIETESVRLDGEDTVVQNGRGTDIPNPRLTVLERMAGREMALMRTLRMGGRSNGESPDTMAAHRKLQRRADAAQAELAAEDALLA